MSVLEGVLADGRLVDLAVPQPGVRRLEVGEEARVAADLEQLIAPKGIVRRQHGGLSSCDVERCCLRIENFLPDHIAEGMLAKLEQNEAREHHVSFFSPRPPQLLTSAPAQLFLGPRTQASSNFRPKLEICVATLSIFSS